MQPIVIEDSIAIAAATVIDNVINSNSSLIQYLRVPFNCRGAFAGVISATGIRVDVSIGTRNAISDSDLRVGTDLQVPLDVVNDAFFGEAGQTIIVRASNTTGGSLTLKYKLILVPFAGALPSNIVVMQRGPVTVANNSLDLSLLSGLRYERAPRNCVATFLMTSSAAGMTKKVNIDMEQVAPPSAVSPLNRVPQDPFDTILEGVEVPYDKLIQLLVTNTSGGSLNAFFRVKLQLQ